MAKQFDENEVRKAISVMFRENELFEVRIMSGKKVMSGYFRDIDVLIGKLNQEDLSGKQIYITLNAVNEACYGREQRNRFIWNASPTTSDNDIVGYKWLFIDCDPKRPSGVSSSDEELQYAKDTGNRIYCYMEQIGFEKPLMAYSGNGVHLLYRIALKNSTENKSLIETCIKTLDMLFSDEKVDVDTSTYNPARISKLYGCISRKGSHSEERPHRMSRVIGSPTELKVTDKAYLDKLASFYPKESDKPQRYNNYNPTQFDLEEWLDKHYLRYEKSTYKDGDKYILESCPFDSSHNGKDACLFRSRSGAIGFKCLHNSCSCKTWKDVRIMFEPDAYERQYQETQKMIYGTFNRDKKRESKPIVETEGKPVFYTPIDIFEKPQVEEAFIRTGTYDVDKRLRGLKKGYVSVVSGLRGSAKSTLLSQWAIEAVESGNNVAVFSGELSDKNFMKWMNLQCAGKSRVYENPNYANYFNVKREYCKEIADWLTGHFWLYNNDYGNDFVSITEQFEKAIEEHKLDFLILDNLMAFNITALSDNKWDAQTEFVWTLQRIAKKYDIHVLFVAHPRKALGFLRLDDISGSADLVNAVDNAFIVHRNNQDFRRLTAQMFGWKEDNEIYCATNIIEIAKDRDNGTQDFFVPLWYEKETKRLRNSSDENKIYGWDKENDGFDYAEESPFE